MKMKVARIYIRVSTEEQSVDRQKQLVDEAKSKGFYVAGVYCEKASGARADRPELLRMIRDLQEGDVVIAEKIDRISRLPLNEAENLIDAIKSKGARLAIPGVVDLSEVSEKSDPIAKVVLESVQSMLLKLALQMARDEYETRRIRQQQGIAMAKLEHRYRGRKPNIERNQKIIELRNKGCTIRETAEQLSCSTAQVKLVMKKYTESLNLTNN